MKYLITLSAFMLLLVAPPGWGEIIHVPGDHSTIQEGINEAVEGDTVLVAEGIYSGAGNRNLRFSGKAITLLSESGAEATVIDCGGSAGNVRRGLIFYRGEDNLTVVDGFTVRNGYCRDTVRPWGAGMYCHDASPTIRNCIFSGNEAGSGGGIFCGSQSSPVIANCVISGNSAAVYGAGIWVQNSTPTITNCTIEENICEDRGSGIMCETSVATISYCKIINNTATNNGGGIMCRESDSIVKHCDISGNSVRSIGAGIYCQFSDAMFDCCIISDNEVTTGTPGTRDRGYGGGGAYFAHGAPTITNCVITGNVSASLGGGVRYCTSPGIITNSTIVGNTADEGGGAMYCGGALQVFTNCILRGNEPDEIMAPGQQPAINYCNIEGGWWQGEGNFDEDPCFYPPQAITGFTCSLRPDSPCIDAGDPSMLDTIYDAHMRWPEGYTNGERSDIGAYGGPGNIDWLIFPCFSDTAGWD